MTSEPEPLCINAIRQEKRGESFSKPYVTTLTRTNPSIENSGPKLSSQLAPLPNEKRAWHASATIVVFYYAIAASCSALLSGCTLGFPSGAVLDLTDSELRREYKFDDQLSDIFGLLGPLGALFGGLIGGFLTDWLGRKPSLLLGVLPHFFGYLTMVYAHMIQHPVLFKVVLMFGRFLTGVGLGWSTLVTPVFIAEISPRRLRGMLSFFSQLLLSFGLLVAFLLGSFSSFKYYDGALVISGLATVTMLVVLPAPETPRWLLVHGQRSRAIYTLRHLRGKNSDINHELCEIENDIAKTCDHKFSQTVKMLISKAVLAPLFIILFAQFFQACSGISAATSYSASIFKSAGVKDYRSTSAYTSGTVQLLVTVVAAFFIDTCGRKLLLIASGLGGFAATLMLGVHFYITRPSLCNQSLNKTVQFLSTDVAITDCNQQFAPLAIVSLMLFYSAFTIGWGPIPGILYGELLPLRVRGVASGFASMMSWSFSALVTGTYLNFTEILEPWFVWWVYSLINLASAVFVVVFVFETKGKSLEEIEERFRRHKCIHCCYT